jgi:hypothetical protein
VAEDGVLAAGSARVEGCRMTKEEVAGESETGGGVGERQESAGAGRVTGTRARSRAT